MTTFRKAGTRVRRSDNRKRVHAGMKYGAATGVLMEDARIGNGAGWDVYDIRLDSGAEESAYGFDLEPIRVAAKKTGAYCSICKGPHVYKHGR